MQPALLGLVLLLGQSEKYPRAELLLEPAELTKPEVAKTFHILDARPHEKYDAGHIPNAVWVDHDAWAKAFTAAQDPKDWAERIGKVGITSPEVKVVIYDASMSKEAARVWWILRYWGVKDVRLLHGGYVGWTAAKGAISTATPEIRPARYAVPEPQAQRLATKDFVLDQLKEKKYQIIDTRSEKEFCGIDVKAKRGGAIPGAMHLEWSDALDKKTHRFKPAGELAKLLKDAGIDVDRPAVTYCQSGGRAAVMAFTLELMGAKDVRDYYRSWAEWGNDPHTPVVTPKKK